MQLCAVYLRNKSPPHALGNKILYEMQYGHIPSVRHLMVFGSTFYVIITNTIITKNMKSHQEQEQTYWMWKPKVLVHNINSSIGLSKVDSNAIHESMHMHMQLAGIFIYLTTVRPNLSCGISYISQFIIAPKVENLAASKRVHQYVK